jgi:signal transduction histidine kinase
MKVSAPLILVIDDEESTRDSCDAVLTQEGYRVKTAAIPSEGLRFFREEAPDVTLVDLKLPDKSAAEVIREISAGDPDAVCVVISGYATVESAVEAMRNGAYDFLPKPFTPDELRAVTRRSLEKQRLLLETRRLRDEKRRMTENFVTIVTHEINAPLVAVAQYLDALIDGAPGRPDARQRDTLVKCRERVQWLLTLVREWLSMSRLQSGELIGKLEIVDLRNVFEKAIEFVRPQATPRSIGFEISVPDSIPAIEADPEGLGHVFMNLLSNAVKYNRDGGTVRISVTDKGDSVAVSVTDTGIGIPRESMPFIFDEFFRVKSACHSRTTGTGLGLTIVKRIVEAHLGRVEVDSRPGFGSTFTVYLHKNLNPVQIGNGSEECVS